MQKGEEAKLKAQAEAIKQLTTDDFKFHRMGVKEVISHFKSSPFNGLTDAEAKKRLEEYGPN